MEYNLSGTISLNDYIQFNKFHAKQGFRKILHIVLYSFLIIYFAYTIFSIETSLPSNVLFLIVLVIIIVIAILVILLNTVIMRLVYKKHYNANKSLQQVQNIKINEQSISILTEDGSMIFTKSNINKIKYDKDTIYIYQSLNVANIIKKRFLENENDWGELVDFVKQHYTEK